jgi:hypothetical protein
MTCGWPLLSAALPQAGHAVQRLEPRVEIVLADRYIWRGIRRAAGPNAQLQASLTGVAGRTRWGFGAWSNVELTRHRDSALTDLRPGSWGPGEYDAWLEVARDVGWGDLALGAIWYQYAGRSQLGTGEVYAWFRGAGLNPHRVAPEISVWYDPVRRKSGYVESTVTAPVLALPLLRPTVLAYTALTAGAAVGRPRQVRGLRPSTFTGSGLSHAELSGGLRVRNGTAVGTLIVNLAAHLLYARDDAARRRSLRPDDLSDRLRPYLTAEVGLSWPRRTER